MYWERKKISLNAVRHVFFVACIACVSGFVSCGDESESETGVVYDPSKPIVLSSFEPDSGGMATKVFIHGSNFGTDLSKIRVYFNGMRAPVVGSDGNHIYSITPRQPGEKCTISVAVNGDSVSFGNKQFLYRTMTTVTTIAGKKGTTNFHAGALTEATFGHPIFLCTDAEGNIFVSDWYGSDNMFVFALINVEKNIVQSLYAGYGGGNALGAPAADADGKVIMAPTDGGDGFYSFDPDALWTPKVRQILHPSAEQIADGFTNFGIDYKASFASCQLNGKFYTRAVNGQLIQFDPADRTGDQIATGLQAGATQSYMVFDRYRPNIMYLAYQNRFCIYTYDILTGEHTPFAGTAGVSGWKDGNRLEAEFSYLEQLVMDQDGSLVIADRGNHCIRRISPDGMVSTIVGKGGVAGYQDGNPEDALFDMPRGVAIDRDYNIYIADYNNNVVRKLSVE